METVILVHGLWMTGLVMRPLGRRLRRCGFRPVLFGYPSLRRTIGSNAHALVRKVRQQPSRRVHLVGHSLGGLVILQALHSDPGLTDGRIVLLGSPVNGSRVARQLAGRRLIRSLVGRAADDGLLSGVAGWTGRQALGVIAGSRPIGVGRVPGWLQGPNDGTVSIAETRLAGATASVVVDTTHTGLVLSAAVARCVCRFLRKACF